MDKKLMKVACILFGVAMVAVLGLFELGVWGTTPSDPATMVGSMSVVMDDGSTLFSLEADAGGKATVEYRGVTLEGTLSRVMSNQTSGTYQLGISKASLGLAEDLSFSIEVPVAGIAGDGSGKWCVRFRDSGVEEQGSGMGSLFIGMSQPSVWYSQFESEESLPYEAFDWFELYSDGTGKMINERFIPMDLSDDDLAAAARDVSWHNDGGTIRLSELQQYADLLQRKD